MRFIGIDVSADRGCAVAALDDAGELRGTRWVEAKASEVAAAIEDLRDSDTLTIGIDAPRKPLTQLRSYRWDSTARRWRKLGPRELVRGRHCEVVVRSLGLANPQWTPLYQDAPPWMKVGFCLFATLEEHGTVHEVFPSATYKQLDCRDEPLVRLSFRRFHSSGPKDMLDAVGAALTVAEYAAGRGVEIGDGDGLGSIVLPCPLDEETPRELLQWPGDSG